MIWNNIIPDTRYLIDHNYAIDCHELWSMFPFL